MIGLKIKGIWVDLLPNQSIKFDLQYLLLETDFVAGQKTFNFKLACNPKNQNLFGFPENIPALETVNYFEAELYFKGVLLFVGKFALRKATQQYYEGNFMWGSADLVAYKDTLLQDMLKNWTFLFDENLPANGTTGFTDLETTKDGSREICFPVVKINNNVHNAYRNGSYELITIPDKNWLLPMVNVFKTLQKCLEEIGYTLIDDFSANLPELKKLIFWNTKYLPCSFEKSWTTGTVDDGFGATMDYRYEVLSTFRLYNKVLLAQYLPNMKFKDLINLFRICFGIYPIFDSTYKTVQFKFYKDIFGQSSVVNDYTKKVESYYEIDKQEWEGVTFSFKKDSSDEMKENEPLSFSSYNILNPIQDKNLLPTAVPAQFNNTVLCIGEHKYYYYVNTDGVVEAKHFSYCTTPVRYGKGEKKLEAPCDTVQVNSEITFEGKNAETAPYSHGGSLKVGMSNISPQKQVFIVPAKVRLKDSNQYPNNRDIAIIGDLPTFTKLDLLVNDTSNFLQDKAMTWQRICNYHRIIPETKQKTGFEVENQAPRILFYHGLQAQKTPAIYQDSNDSATTYPYASPHNYTITGEKIASFALRFEDKEGLVDTFYREYLSALKYSKRVKIKVKLSLDEIINFNPTHLIRIKESVFVCEKVSFEINDEIQLAELELLKYTGNSVVPPFEEAPTYTEEVLIHARGSFYPEVELPTNYTLTEVFGGADSNITGYSLVNTIGNKYKIIPTYKAGKSEVCFSLRYNVQGTLPLFNSLNYNFNDNVSNDVILSFRDRIINPVLPALSGGELHRFRIRYAETVDFNSMPLKTWTEVENDILLMSAGTVWQLQVICFAQNPFGNFRLQFDIHNNINTVKIIGDSQQPNWRALTEGLYHNGTDNYILNQSLALQNFIQPESNPYTFSAVFKIVDTSTNVFRWNFIRTNANVNDSYNYTNFSYYLVGFSDNGLYFQISRGQPAFTTYVYFNVPYTFKQGIYHLLIVNKTSDVGFSEDSVDIYVNGIRIATSVGFISYGAAYFNEALVSASNVYNGTRLVDNGNIYTGKCIYEKIQIQTGNLTNSQARNLFNSNELDLTSANILNYNFKAANVTGSSLNDLSGNAYHATLNGTSMPTFVDLY